MPRIALFTTECAQLGDALTEILERHHDDIAMVVTSNPYETARGGFVQQLRKNLSTSGPTFSTYLAASFTLYPMAVTADRVLSRVTSRKRTRRSVTEMCAEYGIERLHTGKINSPETVERLKAADLDFIVVYWFDQIIHERVLETASTAVVNIHAAFLPHCRGLFPTLYSAMEDGAPFGITAHLIENREIDAGPVLAQIEAKPPVGRSVIFNDSWVNRTGVDLVGRVLNDFDGLFAQRRVQQGGSYYSYPTPEQVRQARSQGLRLVTLRDFFAVFRGTGAGEAVIEVLPPQSGVEPVTTGA